MNDTPTSCDAVVIGAGVIGSAVTLELTRRDLNVINLDKLPAAGYGSTSSSAAIIRFHYSTLSGVALSWEAMHWWRDWPNHVGSAEHDELAQYVKMPMLMALAPGAELPPFFAHFDTLGLPYRMASMDEVDERWPGFDWGLYGPPAALDDTTSSFWADEPKGRHEKALVMEDAGFITDPALAAQNLAAAAVAEGAEFRFRSEVVSIDRNDDGTRVAGVTLADGTAISAPVVINVGGPHSTILNRMAGVDGEMARRGRALRREVYLAPAPMERFDSEGFIMGDLDVGVYFRPERGNNILVGSTEPACDPLVWVEDPDSLDETLTEDDFQVHMLRIARRIPGFGIPHSKQGLVAMYDATEDWTPIYDRSSLDGYYMACGTSGNQFKNAPVAGWLMAELVTAVEAGHDHDADPLTLNGPVTGMPIDMRTFSRLREVDASAGNTVLG